MQFEEPQKNMENGKKEKENRLDEVKEKKKTTLEHSRQRRPTFISPFSRYVYTSIHTLIYVLARKETPFSNKNNYGNLR